MRWSASSLQHNCAYPNVLSKLVPKSASNKKACDKGSLFHQSVYEWSRHPEWQAAPDTLDAEVNGWLKALADQWAPSPEEFFELALGIDVTGAFVPVEETEPHVYAPQVKLRAPLLTAGRADVAACHAGVVVVRDWKTGRHANMDVRQSLQLTALAFAAASMFSVDAFVRELYWTRDGRTYADAEPIALDSEAAADAWAMLEKAARLDEKPHPGEHCSQCWESRLKRCTFAAGKAA